MTVTANNLKPHKDYFRANNDTNELVLEDILQLNEIPIKRNLATFLFKLFQKTSNDFAHSSISDRTFYSRYQIENVEKNYSIDLPDVKDIFEAQLSNVEKMIEIQKDGEFEQFYYLLKQQYLEYPEINIKNIFMYKALLKNILLLKEQIDVERNDFFTNSYPDSIFYRVKNILL